ncbi:MAG: fimbria/pilus outer membrane usher protein [Gammaproteobacteria bacterium]
MPRYGSLGLAYFREDHRTGPDTELASASYSIVLWSLGFLSLSAITDLTSDSGTTLLLSFVRPLGESSSVSAGLQLQDSQEHAQLAVQRNLPRGPGFGYRLLAEKGGSERIEAGLSLQRDIGLYSANVVHTDHETSYRLGASGGVAALGGQLFLARPINGSFAVAEVPGQPNVPVYQDNQMVAHTNRKGYALLPMLRPYEKNPLSIDPATLPLATQLGETRINAIPYRRSGVLVRFDVEAQRAATLRIVLADGSPLPAGAAVEVEGREERFPVALEGEVYVTGLSEVTTLRASWRGQRCDLTVSYPKTEDPLPDLGAFLCEGISP